MNCAKILARICVQMDFHTHESVVICQNCTNSSVLEQQNSCISSKKFSALIFCEGRKSRPQQGQQTLELLLSLLFTPTRSSNVCRIWLGGQCSLAPMVHSEVCLNKYVVSIAPFSTPACPSCSQNTTNIENCSVLHVLAFSFSSIFPGGGSADPICPYVRRPMTIKSVCVTE